MTTNRTGSDMLSSGGLSAYYGLGLFNNWDSMSSLQKALFLSRFGLSTYKFGTGKDFGDTVIPGTNKYGYGGLTINDGLTVMGSGVSLVDGVKNWDFMDALGKVLFGARSLKNTLQSYDIMNKYINGVKAGNPVTSTSGYAGLSAGVSVLDLANNAKNFSNMSTAGKIQAGIRSGLDVANLSKIGSKYIWNKSSSVIDAQDGFNWANATDAELHVDTGAQIGLEKTSENAAEMATGDTLADTASQYLIPGAQVAAGAYGMYEGAKIAKDNWGKGGLEGRQAGLAAGISAAAGAGLIGTGLAAPALTGLAALGPAGWIAGAVLFTGAMAGTMIKTGKSTAQTQRDTFRDIWKDEYKFVDEADDGHYYMTLTNGNKVDVGLDGHGAYTGQTAQGSNKTAQAFDIDLDSDMDFFAGTAGIALNRILMGGDGQGHMAAIDQTGAQIGNAILSGTVGFGADMTKENFETVKKELLGQYSKAGIGTKEDYYAVVNELAAQKRITEEQQISMHQIANMMYDKDGYELSQKLYNHRQQAVDAIKEQAQDASNTASAVTGQETDGAQFPNDGREYVTLPGKIKPGTSYADAVKAVSGVNPSFTKPARIRTKEEIQAENAAKYAQEGQA